MKIIKPDTKKAKPLHVLLADDDADDCFFFKEALAELPISTQLTSVNDGDELMCLLNDEKLILPNVLFLDINMPRKNGIECLSEIKKNKKLKDLPVIVFSTTNTRDTINIILKCGAHIFIHKPNDFAQLRQVIMHSLNIAIERLLSKGHVKYILNAHESR